MLNKLKFNSVLKVLFLAASVYFIYLFADYINTIKNQENKRRYQLTPDGSFVFDTETGKVYLADLKGLKTFIPNP